MLKILINSYTCCPKMGSEPGMGWNWIVNLAYYCELYVISEGEFKSQCEQWCKEHIEVGQNIHWYWNPVSQSTRDKCWNQGDWSFYPLYKQWQRKTADIAREICRSEKINILHQLNMIGFREPGYLWQVSRETGIPFVWGPTDAKEKFPMSYASKAPLKKRLFLNLKNIITIGQLKYGRRVRNAVSTASVVLSASSNSVRTFEKYFGIKSPLMNETGTYSISLTPEERMNKNSFDVLWVGKADFRKQLGLAIHTLATINNKIVKLHIIGSGDFSEYQKEAEQLNVIDQCNFHGSVNHDEVLRMMSQYDVFLFTSVAEGTPHVVLEAIGCGLPVVCFDTCGQGDSITEEIGCKIKLTNPEQSVKEFAEKLCYLYKHRDVLENMSNNCLSRAEQLSWKNKAKQMLELYERVVDAK